MLIVVLLVVGVLLWALRRLPWIDPDVKTTINVVVIVLVALWVLAGLFGHGDGVFNARLW